MARLRVGRRRAMGELRELFWEWDPLGFAPEREVLPKEYDRAVEQTLELLEQDADRVDLVEELSEWAGGVLPLSTSIPEGDLEVRAARIDEWWQEFLARPPEAAERSDFWATPVLGITASAWVFGSALLSLVAGNLLSAEVVEGPVDPLLKLWAGFWSAAIFPAAALMGAPQLPRTNPRFLLGTILLGAEEVVSAVARWLEPALGLDPFFDSDRLQIYSLFVSVLETGLFVAGMFLLIGGLRSVGAAPTRWIRPVAIVLVGLTAASFVLPLLIYGELYVDALAGGLPSYLHGLPLWLAQTAVLGAAVAYLAAGVRARLEPRLAWALAAVGFGAWFLQWSSVGLIITLQQAVPAVGIVSGSLLLILGNVRLPAILGGLALGLGGGGATPPWLEALRSRWAQQRRTLSQPGPSS